MQRSRSSDDSPLRVRMRQGTSGSAVLSRYSSRDVKRTWQGDPGGDVRTLARLSARSVGTELPLLSRLSARGFKKFSLASLSKSSRPSTAESMTSVVRCSKSSLVRYSKSSFVRFFVGVGGWAARSSLAVSGICAGQGPNGASRSIAQRLLRNGIGSGHEAHVLPGWIRTWWHRR